MDDPPSADCGSSVGIDFSATMACSAADERVVATVLVLSLPDLFFAYRKI